MIYLDSAAVVKLVHAEPESAALRGWLDERAETPWISLVRAEIESFRALAHYAPAAVSRLPAVLDQIDLIDLDQRIRMLARTVTPAAVRSLDAIHLGTAQCFRPSLTLFRSETRSRGASWGFAAGSGAWLAPSRGGAVAALPPGEVPARPAEKAASLRDGRCRSSVAPATCLSGLS